MPPPFRSLFLVGDCFLFTSANRPCARPASFALGWGNAGVPHLAGEAIFNFEPEWIRARCAARRFVSTGAQAGVARVCLTFFGRCGTLPPCFVGRRPPACETRIRELASITFELVPHPDNEEGRGVCLRTDALGRNPKLLLWFGSRMAALRSRGPSPCPAQGDRPLRGA